jgi:hypothetical protein
VNKLKLNVEDLTVESLEMAGVEEPRGTVHGFVEATGGCSERCSPNLWEYIWDRTWLK